jgi:hypothetical protein
MMAVVMPRAALGTVKLTSPRLRVSTSPTAWESGL